MFESIDFVRETDSAMLERETESAMEYFWSSEHSLLEDDTINALRQAQTSKTIFVGIGEKLRYIAMNPTQQFPGWEMHGVRNEQDMDLIDQYIAFCKLVSPNAQEVPADDDAQQVPADDDAQEVPADDDAQEVPADDDAQEVPADDDAQEVPADDDAQEVPADGFSDFWGL